MSHNTTQEKHQHMYDSLHKGMFVSISIPIGFFILYVLYQLILIFKKYRKNREIVIHYCCKKDSCPICLEEFSSLIKYKCKHTFCKECSDSWKQVSSTCPLCREEI